ncbi:MAG: hypothetical protein WDN49_04605 [Acetobacteraceae bacterium]
MKRAAPTSSSPGMDREGTLTNPSRSANIGDFVMRVGRPVLIVPATMDKLTLDRVVVGWKETRETRRATGGRPATAEAGRPGHHRRDHPPRKR